MKKLILTITAGFCINLLFSQTPVELANAQLEAYNNRDIDAFVEPYSDSVKVYNDKRELLYQGKETMRAVWKYVCPNTEPELQSAQSYCGEQYRD